jgi:hypothetical protein
VRAERSGRNIVYSSTPGAEDLLDLIADDRRGKKSHEIQVFVRAVALNWPRWAAVIAGLPAQCAITSAPTARRTVGEPVVLLVFAFIPPLEAAARTSSTVT